MSNPTVRDRFTTGEAARLASVKRATLAAWCRSGFVRPSIQTAKGMHQGRGHGHLFSLRDVASLRAIVALRHQGVTLQRLKKIAAHLHRTRGWEDFAAARLVVPMRGEVVIVEGSTIESALRRPGELYLVLDLGTMTREVREALAREDRKAA